jgi:hypothetical protein
MARRVVLVSCVKTKRPEPSPAQDLYVSTLFREMRQYAVRYGDAWYVLSAEHGLLCPHEVVAPYEKTLLRMRKPERDAWAAGVRAQLDQVLQAGDEVTFLAGERYREALQWSCPRSVDG